MAVLPQDRPKGPFVDCSVPSRWAEGKVDIVDAPVYLRIAHAISDRIVAGIYPPGTQLPSESRFTAEFGVSPMTLRRALATLAEQGLVYAEKGRGTFVRSLALGDSLFHLEQGDGKWLDDASEVRLLSAKTSRASARVAERLLIAPGQRVVYLRRLVFTGNVPSMYHMEYVVFDPHRPLVESQLQITSLHGVLQAARGVGFARGEVTLRASSLPDEAASALEQAPGSPCFCLEHVFQDADRQPVSWGWFMLRSDIFLLRAQLGLR